MAKKPKRLHVWAVEMKVGGRWEPFDASLLKCVMDIEADRRRDRGFSARVVPYVRVQPKRRTEVTR